MFPDGVWNDRACEGPSVALDSAGNEAEAHSVAAARRIIALLIMSKWRG
jgi:hypothetical protein